MELIKNLEWRYATKKFDSTKKVTETDLKKIMDAVRLSASSYGLQAYKILLIENPEVRKKLQEVSWDQPQITDSSHLFVFCNYNQVDNSVIDTYIDLTATTKGIDIAYLQQFADFMKSSLVDQTNENKKIWTSKQTYIALANLLSAAAELRIDTCPMEGFDAAAYNEILGLNEKGLSAAVIAAVGYRSNEDETQFTAKVRKPLDLLFERV
ncbi:MAG: NAD(P)H-dependent oxidoreductase [Prolixibacteraceae bacterium]|jgi:nitroreductase/dihydropteridine reductase|nr:NAD(P)H-dependent oxidoreductase [Prolixibacteraceae bacterium]